VQIVLKGYRGMLFLWADASLVDSARSSPDLHDEVAQVSLAGWFGYFTGVGKVHSRSERGTRSWPACYCLSIGDED